MASNCKLPGEKFVTRLAGGALNPGDPVYDTTSDVLYVSLNGASGAGVSHTCALDGVWTLPATAAEVWAIEEPLYWDPGTGFLTNIAGALTRVGTCNAIKAALATTGDIALQNSF